MVSRRGRLDTIDKRERARLGIFPVRPDLVGSHVCGIEIGLGRVEDHSVDAGVRVILVVLDVPVEPAVGVDGEDVAVAGVVVEGVSVDVVRGLLSGEHEDGSCIGISVGSLG